MASVTCFFPYHMVTLVISTPLLFSNYFFQDKRSSVLCRSKQDWVSSVRKNKLFFFFQFRKVEELKRMRNNLKGLRVWEFTLKGILSMVHKTQVMELLNFLK